MSTNDFLGHLYIYIYIKVTVEFTYFFPEKKKYIQSSLAVINNLSFCKCRVAATGQQCRASPNGVHAVPYINLSSSLTFHWGILIFAQPAGNKLKTKKQS